MTSRIASILKRGGVGVLATDTLYGLVARAADPKAVERVYSLKRRRPDKPLIILIAHLTDIEQFGVALPAELKRQLSEYWPGPVSIILPCSRRDLSYLHRGTQALAFRVPAKASLRRLLRRTGPLVAPSANPQGLAPARTLAEARVYFGDQVDFYRRGRTRDHASTIIQITGSNVRVLRQG